MKTNFFALIASVILLLNLGCEPTSESSDTMAEAVASSEPSEPILLTDAQTYTEAPVIDKDGNIYISEPYRGPITKVTPTGEVSTWAETEGANGHRILEDGSHLVCDRVRGAVLKLDETGKEIGIAASTCGEEALRHPNDLILDSYGGFYFTDPRRRGQENDLVGRVCYVDPEGKSHLVAEWEGFPNGITLSPDGKVLFVAEFQRNEIITFPIESPGKVGAESLFNRLPKPENTFLGPDGIAFGPDGNLYVAHFGVGEIQVLNPQGDLIRSISAGENNAWSSNIGFGGKDLKTLYITGNPGPKVDTTGFLIKVDL